MGNTAVDEPIWTVQGDRKRTAVREMFAQIAPTYDRVNGLVSLSLHHRWRAFAVRCLQLKPGDQVLDVCCGTGDFLRPLRKAVGPTGRLVGIDFCGPMLDLAQTKRLADQLALGDAGSLPVASQRFDGVTVGWGIRNVPDIDAAHREAARVLKPGGRFVSIDCALPRNPILRRVAWWTMRRIVPGIGTLFGKTEAYTYLPESTARFWSREQLTESMERAGFRDVRTRDLFLGTVCVHWGEKA